MLPASFRSMSMAETLTENLRTGTVPSRKHLRISPNHRMRHLHQVRKARNPFRWLGRLGIVLTSTNTHTYTPGKPGLTRVNKIRIRFEIRNMRNTTRYRESESFVRLSGPIERSWISRRAAP